MIHGPRRLARLARFAGLGAVALVTGACFATRNDVRLLQADLRTMQQRSARADSLHGVELQEVARHVGAVADSLRIASVFLTRFSSDVLRFQGDLTLSLRSFGQQLIALQELTGQSQKRLSEVRADIETRMAELAATAGRAPGQPAASGAQTAPAGPGPNALLQAAWVQADGQRYAAARAGFQEFLALYPTSDLAPNALFGIAQTFDFERSYAAADSAYQLVVERFPKSEAAPRALFKRAMILKTAGQAARARELFQQIVDQYPRSPEAAVAQEYLKPPE